MAGRQFDGGSHWRKPPLEHGGTPSAAERETKPMDNSSAQPRSGDTMRNLGAEMKTMSRIPGGLPPNGSQR